MWASKDLSIMLPIPTRVVDLPALARIPVARPATGYTNLGDAIRDGKLEDVIPFINSYNIDDIIKNGNGMTALFLAAQEGKIEIVKWLLENKANIHAKSKQWMTPIHGAASQNNIEIMHMLLAAGAKVDDKDLNGFTPLHNACRDGNLEICKLLLERKAVVQDCTTPNGTTPLHVAARHGNRQIVRLILAQTANVDALDTFGRTPLTNSINFGKKHAARALIKAGACTQKVQLDHQMPSWVYDEEEEEIEEIPFKAPAAPTFLNSTPNPTPVKSAFLSDKIEEVEKYINPKNIDEEISISDYTKITPLSVAASVGKLEIVKWLLEKKANVDIKDKELNSVLHQAVSGKNEEVVRLLLKAKANPDDSNNNKATPLHNLASRGSSDMARVFLNEDVKVDLIDAFGRTPLSIAIFNGNEEVGKALLEAGASPLKVNDDLPTPSWAGGTEVRKMAAQDPSRWEVLSALCVSRSEDITWVQTNFDSDLTIEEFRASPNSGPNNGTTGIWFVLRFLSHGNAGAFEWLQKNLGAQLTLDDFRTSSKTGPNQGVSGLLLAMRAAALGKTEAWDFITNRFVDQLTLKDICFKDNAGQTILDWFCKYKATICKAPEHWQKIIAILKNSGKDQVSTLLGNENASTLMCYAATQGVKELLEILIESNFDLNSPQLGGENRGFTPLFCAASYGHTEIVKLILDNRANCDSALEFGNLLGQTPLYTAAVWGHTEVLRLLLDRGAKPDTAVTGGEWLGHTPIFDATYKGHAEVVKLLISRGVNCKLPILFGEARGQTPVYAAAYLGHIEVLKVLMDNGVDCEAHLLSGKAAGLGPLFGAACNGHIEVLKLLVEKGVNPKAVSTWGEWEGETIIYLAARVGQAEFVKALIELGVDPNCPIKTGKAKGKTPIAVAAFQGYDKVVKVLFDHDVELNEPRMSDKINAIVADEVRRRTVILGVINKTNQDKKFTCEWSVQDNLVYLCLKYPTSLWCELSCSFLETNGIQAKISKNKKELRIRKSQSAQFIKLIDACSKSIKLYESIATLFEKRIMEQYTFNEKGIVLNFKPVDHAKLGRMIKLMHGTVQEDGSVLIPLDFINRNDVDYAHLKIVAKKDGDKIEKVLNLAKKHEKIKHEYLAALHFTFKDEESLNGFVKALPICERIENKFVLTCSYDRIHDLQDDLQLANDKPTPPPVTPIIDDKKLRITSFQKALECFIPTDKWIINSEFMEAELGPLCIAALVPLSISGLELFAEKQKLKITMEALEKVSEDSCDRIAREAKENHSKLEDFEKEVVWKVCVNSTKKNAALGFEFCFKNLDRKNCFENLEKLIKTIEGEDLLKRIPYSEILILDQESITSLVGKIEKLKPVSAVAPATRSPKNDYMGEVYNRPAIYPVASQPKANRKGVKNDAVKKKQPHTPPSASKTSKTSAVTKATLSRATETKSIYQAPRHMPPLDKSPVEKPTREAVSMDFVKEPEANIKITLMNQKVSLNDNEACAKHELELLKTIFELNRDDLDPNRFCDEFWLGIIAFLSMQFIDVQKKRKKQEKTLFM